MFKLFFWHKYVISTKEAIALWAKESDSKLLFIFLAMITIGLMLSYSSSPVFASRVGSSDLFIIKRQLIFSAASVAIMCFVSALNRRCLLYISFIALILLISCMAMLCFTGLAAKGAKRWLDLGFFSMQPSEMLKPFFAVINAFMLANYQYIKSTQAKVRIVSSSLAVLITVCSLLLLQPDIGMTFQFLCIWIVQIMVCGIRIKVRTLMATSVIAAGFFSFVVFNSDYASNRLSSFLDGGSSYQVQKSQEAIKGSGIFGAGIFAGSIKYSVPDIHSDYVFSLAIEEFGGLMGLLIIFLYLAVFLRIFFYGMKSNNFFNKILSSGVSAIFFSSFAVSAGAAIGVIPATGSALFFLSYGGSASVSAAIAAGVGLIMSRQRNTLKVINATT